MYGGCSVLGWLFIKAELEQGGDKPGFYAVLRVWVDVSVFNGGIADSPAVITQNLVHRFRIALCRPHNRFIRDKVLIPYVKAPPFLSAGASTSCGFDTRLYSGNVHTFPRFPTVCNARKSKGK